MLPELYNVLKGTSEILPFSSHWMKPGEYRMCQSHHYMSTCILKERVVSKSRAITRNQYRKVNKMHVY